MTPLEAIEKSTHGYTRIRGALDGLALWSNGHILFPGDHLGKEMDGPAKVWSDAIARTDELAASVGMCVEGEHGRVYRALDGRGGMRVWIDEAYRQAFDADGVTANVIGPTKPITFRNALGELVGVATPVMGEHSRSKAVDPSDTTVWRWLACRENGWFRQSKSCVMARIKEELDEAVSSRNDAKNRMESLRDEIAEYDTDIAKLEADLADLRAEVKADAVATVG